MSEILGWAGWAIALITAVFAIRATIRFDVNEWLKERRKQKKERLRVLCTHVDIVQKGEDFEVRSTFISPAGTTALQCQDCRYIKHDRAWIHENPAYWASHTDEWVERMKLIEKLTKKFTGL